MDTTRLGQIIQWRTVPQTVLRLWKNGSRHHLHHRLEFRGGLPAGSWGPSWTWLYASLSKGHREANIRATNPPLPPELKWWTGALQWSASASLTLSVPQSSLTPTPWLMASCRGRRYQCRGRERRGEDHGHMSPRTHTEVRRRPEKLGEHPGTKGLLVALFQELQSFLNGKHHLHLLYQGGIVSIPEIGSHRKLWTSPNPYLLFQVPFPMHG